MNRIPIPSPHPAHYEVWANESALISGVAREIIDLIVAIQQGGGVGGAHGPDGCARVVLTGGGAGIGVLRELAALDHAAQSSAETFPMVSIDWSRVHIFFGDERYVPATHPERNDGQAYSALLDHVAIPPANIHRYDAPRLDEDPAGPGLDAAASSYARVVREFAPAGFDLHLLGMGPEGHVNSLFPHTAELTSQELVVAVRGCPKPPPERVSLTLTAVGTALHVWLLVCGSAKAEAAAHAVAGDDPAQWPAAGARGRSDTIVHLDTHAAARVKAVPVGEVTDPMLRT